MLRAVSTVFLSLLLAACQSGPKAPCAETQAIVESTARANPDIARLTVHRVPQGGSALIAVASTADDKRGKPSDPEDQQAIQTGQVIVLEEEGALDVTVPVLLQDGRYTAAVGVTWRAGTPGGREELTAQARSIAAEIARRMPTPM